MHNGMLANMGLLPYNKLANLQPLQIPNIP